jgi:hypothetical protein
LLGFERLNDIPSEQIPQVYFDYLRDGNADEIYQVIIHNLWDIVSTLGVMIELHRFVKEAEEADRLPDLDSWALGKFYLQRKDLNRAFTNFCKSEKSDGKYHLRNLFEASLLAKKMGDYEAAMNYWEMLSESFNPHFYATLEEMAKYYEHRLRNFDQALSICRRAEEVIYQMSQLETEYTYPNWSERFSKRLQRLQRKLRKSQ